MSDEINENENQEEPVTDETPEEEPVAGEIQSILNSTKKKLGIDADYDAFDHDIIVSINSAFGTLFDVGFGEAPVRITGKDEQWIEVVTDPKLEWIKDYVFMKVKLAFDPPNNSFLIDNYKQQIAELEWRIYAQVNDYLPDVHPV